MSSEIESQLPTGKVETKLLGELLGSLQPDKSVLLGPGIGRDAAVVRAESELLALSTDPITLCSQDVASHLVHICANDVACAGAVPRWLLVTVLLPPQTKRAFLDQLFAQWQPACKQMQLQLVGGHTEVTSAVNRPVAVGCVIGTLTRRRIMRPQDIHPDQAILLTKGLAIEGSYLLYKAHQPELEQRLDKELSQCLSNYLHTPGISVVPDALVAAADRNTRYLHDLTEGGLAAALWELAREASVGMRIKYSQIPIYQATSSLCAEYGVDPLSLLASGALLIITERPGVSHLQEKLDRAGVASHVIGETTAAAGEVCFVREGKSTCLSRAPEEELVRLGVSSEAGVSRGAQGD